VLITTIPLLEDALEVVARSLTAGILLAMIVGKPLCICWTHTANANHLDWLPGMPKVGDADPLDLENGHGTHVSGILAGNHDWFKGVAPDATIYAYKVLGAAVSLSGPFLFGLC